MGQIYADLELANPTNENIGSIMVKALVDTGSLYLCIPAHIAIQLQLKEFQRREVIPTGVGTDGSKRLCDYVGTILLRYANRVTIAKMGFN